MNTREEWLGSALAIIRLYLRDTADVIIPDATRVSCGFPGGGSARKRIGECWPDSASADASTEIFISPILSDANTVLATLLHEAIHAAVGCAAGHKGPFKRVALAAGLEGKMTSTNASAALIETVFPKWLAALGTYPHGALSLLGRKKQSTRLIKCACSKCGYTVRTTQKWIDASGAPYCPALDCKSDFDEMHQMTIDGIPEDSDNE